MKNSEKFLLVKELLRQGDAEKAKELFLKISEENTVEYHFIKGLINQKYQRWGEAINSFNTVIELDPGNDEAKNQIEMIQSILKFWNPETFNP